MYRSFFLLLLAIFFFACTSEQKKAQKNIRILEEEMEKDPAPIAANALIRQYLLYNATYPQERELNSRYLYRAAATQLRLDRPEEAANTLIEVLKQYPETSNTVNNALLLAAVYEERFYDTITPVTIYQVLKEIYPEESSVQEKFNALTPTPAPMENRLNNLRKGIFSDTTGVINYALANYFIHSCELVAMLRPDSQDSPRWLNEAAEIARATRKTPKALQLYEWIYDRYPEYEKAPQALFLRGFLIDEEMEQKEEAREIYQLFLQRYPNHEFADDAQFLLDNLDKNEEEIINQFQQGEKDGSN